MIIGSFAGIWRARLMANGAILRHTNLLKVHGTKTPCPTLCVSARLRAAHELHGLRLRIYPRSLEPLLEHPS